MLINKQDKIRYFVSVKQMSGQQGIISLKVKHMPQDQQYSAYCTDDSPSGISPLPSKHSHDNWPPSTLTKIGPAFLPERFFPALLDRRSEISDSASNIM